MIEDDSKVVPELITISQRLANIEDIQFSSMRGVNEQLHTIALALHEILKVLQSLDSKFPGQQ